MCEYNYKIFRIRIIIYLEILMVNNSEKNNNSPFTKINYATITLTNEQITCKAIKSAGKIEFK